MTDSAPNIADLERALAAGPKPDEAGALLQALVAHHRTDPSGSKVALAGALHRLGHARLHGRDEAGALAAWGEVADLLDDDRHDGQAALTRIDALIETGGLLCARRDGAAAQVPLLRAVELLRREQRATARLAWALNLLASSHRLGGHRSLALDSLREAEAAARAVALASRSARDAATWALLLNNIGRAELELDRPGDACVSMEECLGVTRLLIGQSRTPNHLVLHSAACNRYGQALERTGQLATALLYCTEGAEIMRALVTDGRQDLAHDLEHVERDLRGLTGKLEGVT